MNFTRSKVIQRQLIRRHHLRVIRVTRTFARTRRRYNNRQLHNAIHALSINGSQRGRTRRFQFSLAMRRRTHTIPLQLLRLLFLHLLTFQTRMNIPQSVFTRRYAAFRARIRAITCLFATNSFRQDSLIRSLPRISFPSHPLQHMIRSRVHNSLRLPSHLSIYQVGIRRHILRRLNLKSTIKYILSRALTMNFIKCSDIST